jgi:cytochrome P450
MTTTTGPLPSLPFIPSNPLEPAEDLARLRAAAAVTRVMVAGAPAWLVTRHDEALTVLTDRRFRLAISGAQAGKDGANNDSLFQDPPEHTRLRRLVSAAFTPRRVAELRRRTTEIATTLIGQMVARRPQADLVEALALPLPIMVIGELLGVPPAERETIRRWSDTLLSQSQTGEADPAAWENLTAQVTDLIARKRRDPGQDLLSALIAVRDTDADSLSDRELMTMAISLVMTGHVTTSVAIGAGTILLIGAGGLARLADDPALVPYALEEVLRFKAPANYVNRVANEDLELGGAGIRADDKVMVSLTSANRDERRFTNPDHFDITRTENPHLSFGHGIHHCLGAALARLELHVTFATLAERLPGLHLAIPANELAWRRFELFADEWPPAVPVSW